MATLKLFTAYAKRSNPIELKNIFTSLPEELAMGCSAETGLGGHYKHKGESGFWVIFGERDVALLRIDDISLVDANRVKDEIVQLFAISRTENLSDLLWSERALKVRAVYPD